MVRNIAFLVAATFALGAAPRSHQPPPACLLLTAPEASKVMGFAVVVDSGDRARMNFNCRYNRNAESVDGIEITWREFPSAQAAHDYLPRWIIPVPPKPADMALIPVKGIGDEATITHGKIANSIYLRVGKVLVKAGTVPVASDSALTYAGKTMAGRL